MADTVTELTELPSLDQQHPCETLIRSTDPQQPDLWEPCGNLTAWLVLATCTACGPVRDFVCNPCYDGAVMLLLCGTCERPVTAIDAQAV